MILSSKRIIIVALCGKQYPILVEDELSMVIQIYKKMEIEMKPGVFTQLYTHLVFAVKYRERLLKKEIRTEVLSDISGTITNRKHKSIIVNGVPDHIHMLIGLNPNEKISDLVATIKRSSSIYINHQNWFGVSFIGRMDMERFHIADHNWRICIDT